MDFKKDWVEYPISYMCKCDDIANVGMMQEDWLLLMQDFAQVTYHKIESVVEQINECDIPFIEKYIAYFEGHPQ